MKKLENEDLIKAFEKYLKMELNLSSNTQESYKRDILQFENLTNKEFSKIDNDDLNLYIRFLNDNYKSSSHSRKISSLKKFYKYIEKDFEIDNIFSNTKNPKKEKNLPIYFSNEIIINLLESIDLNSNIDIRDRAMMEVLYATGVRVSEILELKTYNLKLEENFIYVIGKGNKERIIPITNRAIKYLSTYLRIRIEFLKTQEDTLFLNSTGKPMTRQGFDKILKTRAKKIGISNISAHKFRHSIATHLLDKGADLKMIQNFLGHKNITTTEAYTHVSKKKLREEYEKYLDLDI